MNGTGHINQFALIPERCVHPDSKEGDILMRIHGAVWGLETANNIVPVFRLAVRKLGEAKYRELDLPFKTRTIYGVMGIRAGGMVKLLISGQVKVEYNK